MRFALLAGCASFFDAPEVTFPLLVPVMRTAEPAPDWAADPDLPGGERSWAARRCAGDPGAPAGEGCSDVAPGVCAAALEAQAPRWDVLLGCPDPAAVERMFGLQADPSWIGRWYAQHERWDVRLLGVVDALSDRAPGDLFPAVNALAQRETPETVAWLMARWDAAPEERRVLATALHASADPGLVSRLDAWCALREDYRCDAARRRERAFSAHPVDDLAAALAMPRVRPEGWVETWPAFRGAILDALERSALGDDPTAATTALRALAFADRPRAAAAAARWEGDGASWEGWDLHEGLERFPDDATWTARVAAAGGAVPAAHLLDGWIRSGAALPAVDNGWSDGGPAEVLAAIFARIPGEDPVFDDHVPAPRDPPFETRGVIYAWWKGERWRVAETGDLSVAAVGLANAMLTEMERPERVGLTGDAAWVVVGPGDLLVAASAEGLVTWYDPSWQTRMQFDLGGDE